MSEAAHINNAPANIKVAIIEDRREIREGLGTLIQFTDGYSCVGRFYSMEEALQQIGANPPDVALLDIGLPGMSGIEGTEILKERYPQILVLVLTVYEDDERIFRAMCAGACGYLLKPRLHDCLKAYAKPLQAARQCRRRSQAGSWRCSANSRRQKMSIINLPHTKRAC